MRRRLRNQKQDAAPRSLLGGPFIFLFSRRPHKKLQSAVKRLSHFHAAGRAQRTRSSGRGQNKFEKWWNFSFFSGYNRFTNGLFGLFPFSKENFMAQHQSDSTVLERVAPAKEAYKPPKYQVVLHNDDYTPMEFVVKILVEVFQRTIDDSLSLMLQVHHDGKGIAGVYVKEIAEEYVEQVKALATENDYPLLVTMEKLASESDSKSNK